MKYIPSEQQDFKFSIKPFISNQGGGWYAPASSARLYKEDDHRLKHVGAWCADPRSNRDKYLQIDFGTRKRITALATQGRDVYFEHVKSYSLSFSDDGSSWHDYREGGNKKVSEHYREIFYIGSGKMDYVAVNAVKFFHPFHM